MYCQVGNLCCFTVDECSFKFFKCSCFAFVLCFISICVFIMVQLLKEEETSYALHSPSRILIPKSGDRSSLVNQLMVHRRVVISLALGIFSAQRLIQGRFVCSQLCFYLINRSLNIVPNCSSSLMYNLIYVLFLLIPSVTYD